MKSGQEGKKWQETEGEAKKHGRWGGSWEGDVCERLQAGNTERREHGTPWNTLSKHRLLDTAPTTYCTHLSVSSPDYFLITKYKKNSAGSQSPDPFHQRAQDIRPGPRLWSLRRPYLAPSGLQVHITDNH